MADLDTLCINTIRMLAVDAVEEAGCGHPGMPMGFAAPAYVLWTRFLRHDPTDPAWPDRDRVVLSAGHGSMLLYAMLHLTGYDLSLDDLRAFRQWGSRTPGHPEYRLTPGVETTTGPLGQGFGNAVGMAMTERFLAAHFNRPGRTIVDHFTYVIASDGDLMEGVCHEAASLAGHLKLGRLICLYDDNRISIEGSTDLAFTEDRAARFAALGWHVQTVPDGNDLGAVERAIAEARAEESRPSLIAIRTHIGYGSPNKQDREVVHGEKLGKEEVLATKRNLGWPEAPTFLVPEEVRAHMGQAVSRGRAMHAAWREIVGRLEREEPELAADWRRWTTGELPADWDREIPEFPPDPKGMATRVASGKVLSALCHRVPNLLGGSADLGTSVKTLIDGAPDFQAGQYHGQNIRFGVREHAMGAITGGMACHGGVLPFASTFLVFSDYFRPAIRLAAMNRLRVIYVFSHDSIGLGEDGPTHQPIEQLASLRAVPGLTVIRPGDAAETAWAWRAALRAQGPVAIVTTRQNVPTIDRTACASAEGLLCGGYILKREASAPPAVLLIGTGSELALALDAALELERQGVAARVVSLPSWELFEAQPQSYRDEVLPPAVRVRLSIEAGSTMGWSRYVGDRGRAIGIDRFGASAPGEVLFERFGFTRERIVREALELLARR